MKNKTYTYSAVILIFLFFVLCLFNVIIPSDDFSENENRYLAEFPEISLKSLADGSFMSEFDSYVCDRFISRDFFVSLKAILEKVSMKKENNGVHFGKNGHLIPVFQKDDDVLNENIEAVKKLSETEKFRLTLCIVPTAFEVKRNELPMFAYNPTERNTIEKINSSFDKNKINIAEPLGLLEMNKDEYIYYRTDHHQTAKGGYLMYRYLSGDLGYTPFNESAFDVKTVSKNFLGTSWSKAMVSGYGPDEIQIYEYKGSNEITVDTGSLYDYSKLETKDKYAFFLGGNHGLTQIKTSVTNGRKLAVIKDSYANNAVPFLANHFEEIYMIDLRYFNGDFFEELYKYSVHDILIMYGSSTFSTDESLSKISSIIDTSEYLDITGGLVKKSGEVNDYYFEDAVFVGDSLTDGLKLYADTFGTFLSNTGVNISDISSAIAANGKSITEQIKSSDAGKFYIMLGINDNIFAESQINGFIRKYGYFVDMIKEYHPKSVIYIQSMLPVSAEKEKTSRFKNELIYKCNEELLNLAVEKGVYFLKVYEEFADEKGHLKDEIAVDGVHFKTPYYTDWYNYLKTHTVPVENKNYTGQQVKTPAFKGGGKYDLDALCDALYEGVGFKDALAPVGINSIKFLYELEPESLLSGQVRAGGGSTAEEIAVFEYDVSFKNAIEKKIDRRIEAKRKAYESYIPKEMAKLKNPVVIIKDDIAVLCISDNNKKAEKIINDFLKNR